ncbi:MAG: hypothetical protein ABSB59_11975 [Streptosporangiaceae bacterium]|jgi:hypothetical protein
MMSVTAPQRAPSTTPLLLDRLCAVLMTLALLTGGTALLVTWQEHTVVVAAGEHTATAVMEAYAAGQALADADSLAIQTIPLGAGPSGQHQDDIAAAEQSLEQVAENNAAGASGSQALQLIEGLVPAYTGLVEQADAHYRMQVASDSGVGLEDLWSASELMHGQLLTGPDSLGFLQSAERRALVSQQSSPWVSPWLSALWIIPALALLGTLAATQRLLGRRLRRILSKYLTVAAAAVIALCLMGSHVIDSERSFRAASGPLQAVVALQEVRTDITDGYGQATLKGLFGTHCGQCSAEQREVQHIVTFDATAKRKADSQAPPCPTTKILGCISTEESLVAADAAAAVASYSRSMAFITGLLILLLLMIPLGLRSPIDEYRYRRI